jgi:lactate racemase
MIGKTMRVHLQYGVDGIDVDVPGSRVSVIEPAFVEGLPDEEASFREAVRQPVESAPLREMIGACERLAVVIPDITRPLPTGRLLGWLMAELSHVPDRNWTIVNGTGSHRVNTDEELRGMVGDEVLRRCRVVNHNSHDPSTMVEAGVSIDGGRVCFNREYVEADRRIVLGFIEPHFMAGFSGGYKGIFPAVADIGSIMRYHSAKVIGDPRSTWGLLEGNPTQDLIRAHGSLLPVDFCINVTLNRRRQITGFYCGDVLAAHRKGCRFAKETAMVRCERPFPVVVTTNGGYPLDQNLYQAVKGMSAAAQIVAPGGLIVAAARCNDGFPDHGNFRMLMMQHDSPRAILETITAPGFSLYDQWEAQLLALIQLKARVALFSEIDPGDVRRAHIEPASDVGGRLVRALDEIGHDAPVAVLPEGPMTIPYLQE